MASRYHMRSKHFHFLLFCLCWCSRWCSADLSERLVETRAEAKAGVAVWPNPVTGNEMQLQFTNLPKGKYDMQLTDATGRIVFAITIPYNGGNSKQTIPFPSSVTQGIYQMRIIDTYTTAITQKLFIKK